MNIQLYLRVILAMAMLVPLMLPAEGLVTPVFAANSILLSPWIGDGSSTSQITFYGPQVKTVNVNAGDRVMLCADSGCSLDIFTDDSLKLTITRPDGSTSIYQWDYSHGNQGHITPERPKDLTSYFGVGNNTVKIELINFYPPIYNSSAYYLVISSTPAPGETCPAPLAGSYGPSPLRGPETPAVDSVLYVAPEWQYNLTVRCKYPFSVVVGTDGRSISLQSDHGGISLNEKGEITATTWQPTNRTSHEVGIIQNDSGVYWSVNTHSTIDVSEVQLDNESKLKNLYLFRRPAWATLPSIDPNRARNFQLSLFAAGAAALVAFSAPEAVTAAGFFVVLDNFVEQNRSQSSQTLEEPTQSNLSRESLQSQFSMNEVPADLSSAIAAEFGPLSNWAAVSTLNSGRMRVSAYTIFNVSGSGFTPNGEVLISIGLPGGNDTITRVITADSNGNINVTLEMSSPDAVSLGSNLLVAVDYQTLQTSLDNFLDGKSNQINVYMAAQMIEVVKDTTPPVTNGSVTCSRDMLGICRSEATITLTATDDLSGVGSTWYSLDGGKSWLPFTQPFTLSTNGIHQFLFKSIDRVGNEETPVSSGPIEIQRFVALANTLLKIDRATTVQTQGITHSNDDVLLTNNTKLLLDVVNYLDQYIQSGNTTLSINQLLKVANRSNMPSYPLSFYRQRCTFVNGPLTIADTSPVYDKCLYVVGDVTIRSTTPRGRLTIVSEGVIYDQTTNAELAAWDTTNGVLFFAQRGYVTSATGSKYTGIIYVPSSNINGPFTNFTLNGGLFASTVSLGSGTTLNAQQAAGFPATTYTLPLSIPSPTVTATLINTPTRTPTSTLMAIPTRTPTPGFTPTRTPTPSFTPTRTLTLTPTAGANTGFVSPSSNTANTGGDGNGFEVSPTNAYLNDTAYAVDVDSGSNFDTTCGSSAKDRHNFYNYNFAIPAGVTIKGIDIQLDAKVDSTSGSPIFCVQLSSDGGVTWTTAKTTAMLGVSETTYILGGSTDPWGRSWSIGDLSNANFRVRVISVAGSTLRDFYLEWIGVRISYQ